MAIAPLLDQVLRGVLPVRIVAYDGSAIDRPDAVGTIRLRSERGLARILSRPGELGIVRAYVAGDLDLEGDLLELLADGAMIDFGLGDIDAIALARLLRETGLGVLRSPPAPPEEAHLRGGLHSRSRDRHAITHHYDVSNEFYEMVLGPSLVYSCAVWTDPTITLEQAQSNKLELVCRKLGLRPGMRLLDVGCGWGSMVLHAAAHHGVEAVGITLSDAQAEKASKRVYEAGLEDRVEIRVQDYRDVDDRPFDAISSIGMFEHVGRRRMAEYLRDLHELLVPEGRLLNHAISRPGYPQPDTFVGRSRQLARRLANAIGSDHTSKVESALIERYVFPDGELHEVGVLISMMQETGFEVRHVESLREHYDLTLQRWVRNLEENWDAAVAQVGEGRARVWLLYMAASAVSFRTGSVQIEQVLATRTTDGRSGMDLRPSF